MASEAQAVAPARRSLLKRIGIVLLAGASILVVSALVWQGITASGNPDPDASHLSPARRHRRYGAARLPRRP